MKAARASQLFEQHQQFVQGWILLHDLACRQLSVSTADHYYLILFSRYGTMTAGELAQRSGRTTGAVTGVIARLKKMRLIWRTFDPADRRKVILEPNQTRLSEHMTAYNEIFRTGFEGLFRNFSEPQSKLLDRFLAAGLEQVEEYLGESSQD